MVRLLKLRYLNISFTFGLDRSGVTFFRVFLSVYYLYCYARSKCYSIKLWSNRWPQTTQLKTKTIFSIKDKHSLDNKTIIQSCKKKLNISWSTCFHIIIFVIAIVHLYQPSFISSDILNLSYRSLIEDTSVSIEISNVSLLSPLLCHVFCAKQKTKHILKPCSLQLPTSK